MPETRNDREPWRDPIVSEVRRLREALFSAAGYDIHEYCRRLRQEQLTSGHEVVTRARRSSATPGAAA